MILYKNLGEILMKLRNSLAILCSAAFCFSLALMGCNTRNNGGQTGKDTWTVTFNSMGGSEIVPVEVKNGETVEKPTDPTKENYTFKQWCEDEVGVTPFDFNTPITTNWTLFATWTLGGGSGGGGGDVVPPDPATYPYYVTIGSNTKGLTEVEKDVSDPSNLVSKYKATLESVTAGAQITFTDGNETIRPGSDAEDATNKNNKNGSWDDGFTIHNDATNVEVWLKKWSDGYSFWITGYEKDESEVITYTCTGLPSWITSDGCVIFVWTWGSFDDGSWHSATFINEGAALTFEVNNELDGFLLARCVSGTTQPDWEIKSGNNPGRVYNKTNNITCTSGTYSYVCSDWVAYNG